jgi:hypothetical protein
MNAKNCKHEFEKCISLPIWCGHQPFRSHVPQWLVPRLKSSPLPSRFVVMSANFPASRKAREKRGTRHPDIFHYIYALLRRPEYRERPAANLRANCHPLSS